MSWLVGIRDGLDAAWAFLLMGVLHGTALAALTTVLAVTILKRARPALMTAIWSVVLIKFAVPLGPAIPLSLSGFLNSLLDPGNTAAVPAAISRTPGDAGALITLTPGEVAVLLAELAIFLLYAALVARVLVRSARAQRAHRAWSEALPGAPDAVVAVANQAARIVGLRSLPTVRMSEALSAPQIVGLFRPVLVIPAHVMSERDVLHAALVHEMAHLRRGDTWLRALQLFMSALFFFWPVVAWVNRRIDTYREIACDQWAITWGKLTAEQYARALVELARRGITRTPAEVTLVTITLGALSSSRGNQLHERIQVLLRGGTKPRIGWLSGLGLAAWMLISLGGTDSASANMPAVRAECEIEPGLVEYILTAFPEADADGDGELSRDEVCAYQKRIKEEMSSLDDNAQVIIQEREHRLVSLENEWLECAACSCNPEESDKPFERRICTADSLSP